jgi:putative phosphoribosyl transferase
MHSPPRILFVKLRRACEEGRRILWTIMATTDHSGRAVTIGEKRLEGELAGPADPRGLIIFAHGSGSNRHSPRNTFVAESLRRSGFATLLIDLLTEAEAGDRRNVFDIHLPAERVVEALAWARDDAEAGALPIGLFGASTGAAEALVAAAAADDVAAVVSRGGPQNALRRLHSRFHR